MRSVYKGPYADLIFENEENFIAQNNELKAHVEILKQNVQSCSIFGFEKATPAQNKKRYRALCEALDDLYHTNIGRQILIQLTQNVTLVSLKAPAGSPFAGVHGISWGYLELANIAPDTLFKRPYYETMEAIAHELMHIAHYCLEQDVLAEVRQAGELPHLNAYDLFSLKFLNEAGAYITGQCVSYCFHPNIQEFLKKNKQLPLSLEPVFRDKMYWQEHYKEVLENLKSPSHTDEAIRPVHTKAYYAVQRAYFELHPDLQSAQITRYIHKGYKLLSDVIKEDLRAHPTKKLTPNQFRNIYSGVVPYLVQVAQKLKV